MDEMTKCSGEDSPGNRCEPSRGQLCEGHPKAAQLPVSSEASEAVPGGPYGSSSSHSHWVRILIMPILQAIIGILWILIWALSASFLLSQVPEDYTPKADFREKNAVLHVSTFAVTPGGIRILRGSLGNCSLRDS